jgi:hypothetical protein
VGQITSPSLNSPPSRPALQQSGPADGAIAKFEALYRANVAAVTAYFARRSADPQTVADLTADTFVQAITSFATFDPGRLSGPAPGIPAVAHWLAKASVLRGR